MKRSLLSLALLAALTASPAHAADPALEKRLKVLEDRVATLEAELAQKRRAFESHPAKTRRYRAFVPRARSPGRKIGVSLLS
jgi:hypothetical protein